MQTISLFLLILICGIASTTDSQSFLPQNEGYGPVPYDGNFSIHTFAGDWNVVLFKGLIPSEIVASCPTVQVNKSLTNTLTISLAYVAFNSSDNMTEYVTISETYQPNPLNKAQLLEVSSLGQKSLAVSYYNHTAGEVVLVRTDLSYFFALSKAKTLTNECRMAAGTIIQEIWGSLSFTSFDNSNCYSPLPVAKNFNPVDFEGFFYGNAYYLMGAQPYYSCMTANIELKNKSLTFNLTKLWGGNFINTTETYVQSLSSTEFFWQTGKYASSRLSVHYYDQVNDLYLIMKDDFDYAGTFFGMIISKTPNLDPAIISQVESLLKADGLIVNSQTFEILAECPSSSIFDIIS